MKGYIWAVNIVNKILLRVVEVAIVESYLEAKLGVDRAALDVAIKLNIPHGGWVPKA